MYVPTRLIFWLCKHITLKVTAQFVILLPPRKTDWHFIVRRYRVGYKKTLLRFSNVDALYSYNFPLSCRYTDRLHWKWKFLWIQNKYAVMQKMNKKYGLISRDYIPLLNLCRIEFFLSSILHFNFFNFKVNKII